MIIDDIQKYPEILLSDCKIGFVGNFNVQFGQAVPVSLTFKTNVVIFDLSFSSIFLVPSIPSV